MPAAAAHTPVVESPARAERAELITDELELYCLICRERIGAHEVVMIWAPRRDRPGAVAHIVCAEDAVPEVRS